MSTEPDSPALPPIIVTDATCDLPAATIQAYDIRVIPLKIAFGSETYLSGVDIDLDRLFERMAKGDVHPVTSPPTEEEFQALYQALAAENRPILSIHASQGLSQTVLNARKAARRVPGSMITLWDSQMISGALALQALTAARAARAGYTVEQITPLLRQTHQAGNFLFCLDDLSYLLRGGRIGAVSYYVAQTLRLKPIITVSKDGNTLGTYIAGAERPHSLRGAVDAFVRHLTKEVGAGHKLRALCLHGDATTVELAADLSQKLRERFDCVYLEIAPTAPVLLVHTGPRGVAVGYAAGDWPV
jgi:DegV family protein with EDD domain